MRESRRQSRQTEETGNEKQKIYEREKKTKTEAAGLKYTYAAI